jgi:hypothetical protein
MVPVETRVWWRSLLDVPTYRDAENECEQALRAAGDDEEKARSLLLARIVLELQDENSQMEAIAEALGGGPGTEAT